jgi:hypothetical protein
MAARKTKSSPKSTARPSSASAAAAEAPPVRDAARIHPTTVSIGRFNAASTHLARNLGVPVLPDATDAIQWAPDLLEQAVSERKIVAMVGEKGTGKSVAADRAVARHDAAEQLKRRLDERYPTVRTVTVLCPRGADARAIIVEVYRAAFDASPLERAKGVRKTDQDLLAETVVRLLDECVGVLVIDEAELLLDEGMDALRDINAKSERTAVERYDGNGDKLAAGVGILLVGTYDVEVALGSSLEDGQRATRVRRLAGLNPAAVPDVYTRLLPAFAQGAKQMGKRKWERFIETEVTHRLSVPIRFLETHTRHYVRRMAENHPETEHGKDIPWDAAEFTYTLSELRRPSMMGAASRTAEESEHEDVSSVGDQSNGADTGSVGPQENAA